METPQNDITAWVLTTLSAVVAVILGIVQHLATKEKKTSAEQMREMLELMKAMREMENETEKDEK